MDAPQPLTDFVFTAHAQSEMKRRQIAEEEVQAALAAPEQIEWARPSRAVYQARMERGAPPKVYLLRVFVDVDFTPPRVVTAYRTSKIEKYWRTP